MACCVHLLVQHSRCALQIPYPCNAVVPGMIKMNMARFVLWHDAKEWRFVLKENWMTAATTPDAIIQGQQLTPMV